MAAPCPSTLEQYQQQAQKILHPTVWKYLSEGDSRVNSLNSPLLWPRPLTNVKHGNTRLTLFKETLEHPILLAPIAYQGLFHPDGESASAMAASAQGSQYLISSLASKSFDHIVNAAQGGSAASPWFQLYWQGNRERSLRLLEKATQAGCRCVVFTVDAPIKPSSLTLPTHIAAVNLEISLTLGAGDSIVFDGWMVQAPTWEDLDWLRQNTSLPLLIKGVLHPDDAQLAFDAGCDGIIISNHGGRVLEGTPTSLDALKNIAQRLPENFPILLDSGIRNGRDVFVALAHGATAVLMGRPYIWGLAVNGALGVAHTIRLMRDELEMYMALTGCAQLSTIGKHCLAREYTPRT